MSTLLANFIDTAVPEARRGMFHHADNVLTGVGYRTHHIATDNILSNSEDAETVDLIDQVERTIIDAMVSQVSEYGIGIKQYELGTVTAIFTGLNDMPHFGDQQAILDICDNDDLPEETFADILALIYNDVPERYIAVLDYVTPSLIQRIIANASQFVDALDEQLEEDDSEAPAEEPIERLDGESGVGEQTRAIVQEFVNQHRPKGFVEMIHGGARLGYSLATYLNQTLVNPEMTAEEIASEYMAAALATGESPMTAVQKASDRLEARVPDIHVLQQVLQILRGYLSEGKTQ